MHFSKDLRCFLENKLLIYYLLSQTSQGLTVLIQFGDSRSKNITFCKHLSTIDQNNSMIFTTMMMLKEKNSRLKKNIKIPSNNWVELRVEKLHCKSKKYFANQKRRKNNFIAGASKNTKERLASNKWVPPARRE